jgi:hypothetical protein
VRRRLPKWLRQAEIDISRFLKSDSALTATVIHVHELDPVRECARNNRRVSALGYGELEGNHE